MGGMLPGVAAANSLPDDDQDRTTSDGAAVGEADREADMQRSGADGDNDESLTAPGAGLMSDDLEVVKGGSGDDVPVGAADAEADRERTTDG